MFYEFNENWKIISSSNIKINENCIEIEFSEDQISKLNKWYLFIDWEFIESDESIAFYNNQLENKVSEIKEKYQKIIFEKYSLTDQLNLSNEAIYITSMATFERRDFTQEEIKKLNEIKDAKIWIDEQRKFCSEEILLLSNV